MAKASVKSGSKIKVKPTPKTPKKGVGKAGSELQKNVK
jgi:hypothetical protein